MPRLKKAAKAAAPTHAVVTIEDRISHPPEQRLSQEGKSSVKEKCFVFILAIGCVGLRESDEAQREKLLKGVYLLLDRSAYSAHAFKKDSGDVSTALVLEFPGDDLDAYQFARDLLGSFMARSSHRLKLALHFGLRGDESEQITREANLIAGSKQLVITDRAKNILMDLGEPEDFFLLGGCMRTPKGHRLNIFRLAPTPPEGVLDKAEQVETTAKDKGHLTDNHYARKEVIALRLMALKKDLITGLILVLSAFCLNRIIEKLAPRWDLQSYNFLQHFSLPSEDAGSSMAIVDFGEKLDYTDGMPNDYHTNLTLLTETINQIASAHPRAIGIDIDFGAQQEVAHPSEKFYIDQGTPFLDSMLKINSSVPVVLGASLPDFDLPAAEKLAAHCYVPLDSYTGEILIYRHLLIDHVPMPSLAEKLCDFYNRDPNGIKLPESTLWTTPYGHFIDPPNPSATASSNHAANGGTEFLNYASEDQIREATYNVNSSGNLVWGDGSLMSSEDLRSLFHDRVVLVGSSTTQNDRYWQGSENKMVSGLLLQALAVDTLLHSPLRQFSYLTSALLDLLCGFLILGGSLLFRWHYIAHMDEPNEAHLCRTLTALIAAGTLVGGILLVRILNILWLDYFIVAGLLFFQPEIERTITRFGNWCKFRARRFRQWIFAE